MHASAVVFLLAMSLLIGFLAVAIYSSGRRLAVCVEVQSPLCNTITCPCDAASTPCAGSAYRVNETGQTVCSSDPVTPLPTSKD